MKSLSLFILLNCFTSLCHAQTKFNSDSTLKFNQRFTHCETKWIVLSKKDTASTYIFGYVYIDQQAGFTFDLKGSFSVDKNNRYIVDTSISKNRSVKYRISPNWQAVALLPSQHFQELNVAATPDWVKNYYNYTDTAKHNYRWGWIYNDLNEPIIALTYLEQAYKANPHAEGIEFEIAFAYNSLNKYDEVIKIMGPAIKNQPGNPLFYKELGYAYSHKNEYEKAIDIYKNGLEHFPDKQIEARGELAFNMANAYKKLGKADEYKNWMIKAKSYTPSNSSFYQSIINAGF